MHIHAYCVIILLQKKYDIVLIVDLKKSYDEYIASDSKYRIMIFIAYNIVLEVYFQFFTHRNINLSLRM